MALRDLTQLFSLRDLRNAALGTLVVIGGLGLAGLTLYAHQAGNARLAGIAAGVSLVFVLVILIFIVPPLARNAGREASQLNLPFEFTTGGAIMLVLVLIVGFSAWNTGNNLLFIVLSFLIAAMIVGFFAGSISLKKLDIKMRFPETIFAGEPVPILVSLTNRKRIFPAFSVVAEVRGKERDRSIVADELDAMLPQWIATRLGRGPLIRRTLNHFVHLGRNATEEVRTLHVFPNRGRLSIRDFELSTKFPFGFFRHRRRLPARTAELIVMPKVEAVNVELDHLPTNAGPRPATKRGTGIDLLALRNYQPQDDLRHIDWKATARTRQLTVREFADEDDLRVTILFDTHVEPTEEDRRSIREKLAAEQDGKPVIASEQFEKGARLAASMLSYFSSENAEFRLVIDSEGGEFGFGRSHLFASLKRLTIAEPSFHAPYTPDELNLDLERILNEREDDHRFLLTASLVTASSEFARTLKIINF